MEISLDNTPGHVIHSYQDNQIQINQKIYTQNLILTAEKIICPWPVNNIDEIDREQCKNIIDLNPDVIILGTGEKQLFLRPAIIAIFAEARIGLEAMSTQAACRTYNVLMSEYRKVVAALLL